MKEKVMDSSITRLVTAPFPMLELQYLLNEKNDKQKRHLLGLLNLHLKVPKNKPFPTGGLLQLIRKKSKSPKERQQMLQGIILSIADVYDENEITDEVFLSLEEEKSAKYGPWHYYWALLCYPDPSDQINERLLALREELLNVQEMPAAIAQEAALPPDKEQQKAHAVVSQERARRIKAEMERDRLNKEIRHLESVHQGLIKENHQLKLDAEEAASDVKKLRQEIDLLNKSLRQKEKERNQAAEQKNELRKEIKESESLMAATIEQYEQKLQNSVSPQPVQEVYRSPGMPEILDHVIQDLYSRAFAFSDKLKNRELSRTGQENIRSVIIQSYELINLLERYYHDFFKDEREAVKSPDNDQRIVPVKESGSREALKLNGGSDDEKETESYIGTFYRKDHGGSIMLENGFQFMIPESIVNAVGLEHEAEVECEPKTREDGSTHHNIKILLQGDDSLAPIDQYLGYIELGPYHTYYCVDVHHPENKYPIHERDIEMQQPKDGDPCLFNLAVNGTYARLSRVFRNVDEAREEGEKNSRKKTSGRNDKLQKDTEPFLQGCKVAVIGGQAKWFESVVRQTGADFVHENGENPERIFAELKKSNVLFKLITATSHGAIWAGVEIAKAHGIPHFLIEGSKSNLRMQLWEKRHLIRGSLPGQERAQ